MEILLGTCSRFWLAEQFAQIEFDFYVTYGIIIGGCNTNLHQEALTKRSWAKAI